MDHEIVAACALHLGSIDNYLEVVQKKISSKKRRRRLWMIACHRNRTIQSMENMFEEMLCEDSGEFANFCRMSPIDFDHLLDKLEPYIKKQSTKFREPIPPKVRLAVTLRFLATGDSYRNLHFLFKIASSTISKIIPEVCKAIVTVFKEEIKMPQTPEEWLEIEKGFRENFPHCVGAIDEKHIVLKNPVGSGSKFYNYKKAFSIVLLALVDSNYNFVCVDIGAPGRISDGGVFRHNSLWNKIVTNDLNFPPDCPLPGRSMSVPYVFIGDGAFALSTNVLKPYSGNHESGSPKRVFNYRLSSSRVIVENAFGVLTSVFRVFKKPMALQPNQATLVTMTCVMLHNYLRRRETSRNLYTPPGSFDDIVNGEIVREGSWRQNVSANSAMRPVPNVPRRAAANVLEIRNEFAEYFYNN